METLSSHYARLLGLNDSWRVESVDLQIEDRRVEIRLSHVGSGVSCPECGEACGLADHADERRWRHLDTMQFTTELVARLPRGLTSQLLTAIENGGAGRSIRSGGPRTRRFKPRTMTASKTRGNSGSSTSPICLRSIGDASRRSGTTD